MPLERLFHPKLGRSRKINALDDYDFRIWSAYELTADDYGVMLDSPAVIQAAFGRFEKEPSEQIAAAIDRVVAIGLVVRFVHQDQAYICQLDWQDNQHVRHPRQTLNPVPPDDVLDRCSSKTQALFRARLRKEREERGSDLFADSGNVSEILPEDSRNVSEKLPRAARARVGDQRQQIATAVATASATEESTRETTSSGPARQMPSVAGVKPLDWYRDHESVHVSEFCASFVCLPNKLADEFARRVTGEPFEAARDQVVHWARSIREKWQGRVVPTGDSYAFWRNEWTATHGGNTPRAGPASTGDGLDALRRVARHG